MSQSWAWPRIELSDGAVEAMKWLGLILMTADHAQKYGLMPAVPGVYEAGRVAFPLFGFRARHDTRSHGDPEGSVTTEAAETTHDTVRQGSPNHTRS